MCQCAKVFQFPAPLWRVIRGGSSVRWMCNSISHSFSFFLSLLLTLALAQSFSRILPFSAGGTGLHLQACQHLCVLLAKGRAVYANFTGGHDSAHVHGIMCVHTHIHTLIILAAPAVGPLDSSPLLNVLSNHCCPAKMEKRCCSYSFWPLVTDLKACKFPFVG